MGTFTTVVITRDEGMPKTGWILKAWSKAGIEPELDVDPHDNLGVSDPDGSVSFDDTSYSIQWNSKWSSDHVDEFAERITRKHADLEVQVFEEWDARDADEQGEEHRTYRGGDLTAQAESAIVPTGYAGTAKGLADTLQDDISRNYLSDPVAHTALIGTINRTIEFLRSLA